MQCVHIGLFDVSRKGCFTLFQFNLIQLRHNLWTNPVNPLNLAVKLGYNFLFGVFFPQKGEFLSGYILKTSDPAYT